jgi:hypothetical protein
MRHSRLFRREARPDYGLRWRPVPLATSSSPRQSPFPEGGSRLKTPDSCCPWHAFSLHSVHRLSSANNALRCTCATRNGAQVQPSVMRGHWAGTAAGIRERQALNQRRPLLCATHYYRSPSRSTCRSHWQAWSAPRPKRAPTGHASRARVAELPPRTSKSTRRRPQ